ncbi:uncharacterized protein B0H64DRAFT_467139 [Chaetomium fimeti]|uniref:Uncharacterized protein n=1 Tax=Chaetomium fimeti TaxID=1854472 RepID=A0AAE0H9J5_9PEZI|nr:hypothetical protein B0H64DRAFT_467139 [Chaetomium fimeti]
MESQPRSLPPLGEETRGNGNSGTLGGTIGGEPYVENIQEQNGTPSANGNANGQRHPDQKAPVRKGGDNVPFLKHPPENPDERAQKDCLFHLCRATSGRYYFFINKHCFIRGEREPVASIPKSPKYFTVCPTDWPFNHNSSSSCGSCKTITGLTAVLGQPRHESPSICSICWAYLPTRRDLIRHATQEICRRNVVFRPRLALIWRMYADALRIPGADEISHSTAKERKVRAEAASVARRGKQESHDQAQNELRELPPLEPEPQPPQIPQAFPPSYPKATPHLPPQPCFPQHTTPPPTPPPLVIALSSSPPTAGAGAAAGGGGAVAPPPTPVSTPEPTPPPPPPAERAIPPWPLVGDHAIHAVPPVPPTTTAETETLARSVDRLTGVVSDLAEANKRLLREVRVRDERIRELLCAGMEMEMERRRVLSRSRSPPLRVRVKVKVKVKVAVAFAFSFAGMGGGWSIQRIVLFLVLMAVDKQPAKNKSRK